MHFDIFDMKFEIHEAKTATVDSSWSRKTFPYPHHRIYFITDGSAFLKLKDKSIPLVKENVYLLPAFSLVEAICENTMSQYYIHFQVTSCFKNNIFEILKPVLMYSSKSVAIDCKESFKAIIQNFNANTVYSKLVTNGALCSILAPFFNGVPNAHIKGFERFLDVLQYIDENLSNKISVNILAEIMKLNPVYFSNLFNKTLGMPPSQYIINKRLQKSQSMLANTNISIKKIAFECGFSDEFYFCKIFKQRTGETPGEYRRLLTN